jgi:hypothetical protein
MYCGDARQKKPNFFRKSLQRFQIYISLMVIIEPHLLTTLEKCDVKKLHRKARKLMARNHLISSWHFTILLTI